MARRITRLLRVAIAFWAKSSTIRHDFDTVATLSSIYNISIYEKKTFAAQKLIIKWSLIALRSALYIRLIWDFSLDGNVWYVSRSDIFACSRLSAFQYQKEFQFENGFWYGWIVFLAGRSVIVAWWRFFRLEFANIISVLSNHRTACESPTVCVCVCVLVNKKRNN